MFQMYPLNLLQSKIFPWYIHQAVTVTVTMITLPKITLDAYLDTFREVYRR